MHQAGEIGKTMPERHVYHEQQRGSVLRQAVHDSQCPPTRRQTREAADEICVVYPKRSLHHLTQPERTFLCFERTDGGLGSKGTARTPGFCHIPTDTHTLRHSGILPRLESEAEQT
jgi:hypothetical protein